MKKSGKLKITFVAVLAAITAFAVGAIATPKPANAESATASYDLNLAYEKSQNGVTMHGSNGYITAQLTGSETNPAASPYDGWVAYRVALDKTAAADKTFAKLWVMTKSYGAKWGAAGSDTAGTGPLAARPLILDTDQTWFTWGGGQHTDHIQPTSTEAYAPKSSIVLGGGLDGTYTDKTNGMNLDKNSTKWYVFPLADSSCQYREGTTAGLQTLDVFAWCVSRFQTLSKLEIGEIYGQTADGDFVKLFDPSTASVKDPDSYPTSDNGNYVYMSQMVNDVTGNIWNGGKYYKTDYTLTKNVGYWSTVGAGNGWKEFTLPFGNLPVDVSAYNGISYFVDNSANENPVFINKYFTENAATEGEFTNNASNQVEKWYDNGNLAFLYNEDGTQYTDSYSSQVIPAGFKGRVVIPFQTFATPDWLRFSDKTQVNVLDTDKIASLTLTFQVTAEYPETDKLLLKDFKLVTGARVNYEEHRYVMGADGEYAYENVTRTAVSGSDFVSEKLVDEKYGTTDETDYAKKYVYNDGKYEKGQYNPNDMWGNATVFGRIKGEGDVTWGFRPTTYYDRVKYTVTLDANGGVDVENITAVWGAGVSLPVPTRAGYTFGGWFASGAENPTELTIMPTENVSLAAKWTANEDTPYVVKCALENADGEFVVDEDKTLNLTGITDTTTSVTAPAIDHYVAGTVSQKNINGDGSTVIVINYERKTYTVSFVSAGVDGAVGAEHDSVTAKWGAAAVVTDPAKIANYRFVGWYHGTVNENKVTYGEAFGGTVSKKDDTVYAKFERVVADYVVKHYTENLDGTFVEVEADRETKSGNAGNDTLAEAKSYTGFTAGEVTQTAIAEDGSTVIEIRYARNEYDVVFTDESGSTDPVKVKFGATVTFPTAAAKTGYVFGGWTADGEAVDASAYVLGAGNATFVAVYAPATDTAYVVKHYTENLDGTFAEVEADRENKTGTTGENTAASAKTYVGFTAGEVTQTAIAADGSTVIEIRYARNEYTVTFKANGEVTSTQTVKFGGRVTAPADPEAKGFTFGGWTINGEVVDFGSYTVPAGDVTIEAVLNPVPAPEKKGCGKADIAQLLAVLGALAAAAGIFITKK